MRFLANIDVFGRLWRITANQVHGRFVSILAILFWSIFSVSAYAQTSYVKPKAAISGYSLYVEVTTPADLDYISTHLSAFAQTLRIRVAADVDVARVAQVLGKLDNLEEAVLQRFQGVLSDDDLSQLEWLHSLVLYVPDGKEDALLMNKNWSLIPGVTLVFQTVPDDYSFLKNGRPANALAWWHRITKRKQDWRLMLLRPICHQ